jgi:hypothetical protein
VSLVLFIQFAHVAWSKQLHSSHSVWASVSCRGQANPSCTPTGSPLSTLAPFLNWGSEIANMKCEYYPRKSTHRAGSTHYLSAHKLKKKSNIITKQQYSANNLPVVAKCGQRWQSSFEIGVSSRIVVVFRPDHLHFVSVISYCKIYFD